MWPFKRDNEPAAREEPSFQNASPENPSTNLADPAAWMVDLFGGGRTWAGPEVGERSAIRSTTVFRCVSLVAGIIASLPLPMYERTASGRREAYENRLYPLLHDAPNDLMGSFIWRELMITDLLLGGNHYSLIERDNANRIVGFMPMVRQAVTPYRLDGLTRYRVMIGGDLLDLDQGDVIHVPGLGFDGLRGLSPIGVAGRQSIGLDLAMAEFIARMHANGAKPSGVLEVAANISPQNFSRLKAQFEQENAGIANAGKTIFVDKDSKWTAVQLSPEDAQTLESRRYQVTDICRLFGVPPHMVGETDKTTSWGSGIEQQSLGFLRFTLEPWLKRIEDEFHRKLFPGNSKFYAEFDRDALLAMDSTASAALFASGIQNGWMKPAEVRHLKNLPAADGADQLFINSTMTPISMAGKKSTDSGNGGAAPAAAVPA
ncbi:phage portal protein [Tardiphaga sp.]|uniref:phage portal protein n=1 Tax=Tardiphaga sp. TaxID=1926292 RepID=UPI0026396F82|nr:phage portal protein [Tardiphaga sp.]MDB5618456.1 phage portal protein [Tardiphaga sp.]